MWCSRTFYRDIQLDTDTHFTVKFPDGSILYDWVLTSPWPDSTVLWIQYVFPVENSWPTGIYTITAVFRGNTYEREFGIRTELGIVDLHDSGISLYPNPTSDSIFVEANSQIDKVAIYDVLGRKVFDVTPLAEKIELNMNGLKAGIYIVVISSEGKKTVKKIVKE